MACGDNFYEKFQILVVPIFEENGIFMLDVVFFIQSIFTDRNNNFQKFFFNTHWRYQFPEFKCKKNDAYDYFL